MIEGISYASMLYNDNINNVTKSVRKHLLYENIALKYFTQNDAGEILFIYE